MFAWSVQTISGLDSQSKFQMFTLFSGRHVGVPLEVHKYGGSIIAHIGLCKFVQNILQIFKVWEDVHSNIISWLYSLIGFRVVFFLIATVQPKNRSWEQTWNPSSGAFRIRPKFREIPVQNRIEQKVSGNLFRKFRFTSRGYPLNFPRNLEIPEISCSIWHFYPVWIGPSSFTCETLQWTYLNDLP